MLAKPTHYIVPTKFPSPINLPPLVLLKVPSLQAKTTPKTIPNAISINPTSSNHVSTLDDTLIDDAISAFWDYQFLFVSQRSETTKPITLHVVDGSIPHDFPSGTYYLAGPGLFSDDHGSTVHPFDGHGYLRAFTFDGVDREVKFMAKYVKTQAQVEEHDPTTDTWQFTHRGPFSVLKGGHKVGNTKVMKNVANTSVVRWGERVLCLWEGGEPYEIQSGSLDTVGRFDLINGCDSAVGGGKNSGDIWDVAAGLLKPILYGMYSIYNIIGARCIPDILSQLFYVIDYDSYILRYRRIVVKRVE